MAPRGCGAQLRRFVPTTALAIGVALAIATSAAQAQSQPAVEAPVGPHASSQPTSSSSQQVLAETRPAGLRSLRDGGLETLKQSPAGDLAWRLISSAFVVLVLGILCFVVMKKVVPRINRRGGRNIHIIETAHLGPQRMVHLLEVGGETYLIASTKDRVSLLAEIPATTTFQDAVAQAGRKHAPQGDSSES